eukprot:2261247-Pleurochrysis_carterae.AAC.1
MPLASVVTVMTPASLDAGNMACGARGTPSLASTRPVATSSSSVHSRAAVPPGRRAIHSSPRLQPPVVPPRGGCATA